jgi:beta-glucanase (GH16 family)
MKEIYLLFSFFIGINLFAQTDINEDFESNNTEYLWFADDAQMDTNFSNPQQNASNTSNYVLQYEDVGGNFANVGFDYGESFNLNGTHQFSLMIYVPSSTVTGSSPNQISLKLQNTNIAAPWSTQTEIIKTINLDQWQTVTFDFNSDNYVNLDPNSPAPSQRNDLNRVVLQVNGEDNTDQVTAYIDDFNYTSNSPPVDDDDDPVFDNLVWQDEFNYNGAVDPNKWFHQTLLPQGNSWFNGEIQHYTDRIENAEVSNGTLKIKAKAETYTDQGVTKDYTSARLNSKYAFTFGKVEIKAKLPTGVGTWPALWTLGQNINEDGAYWDNQGFDTTDWPACGEIDIMEHWGDNQDHVSSAIHTPSSFGGTVNTGGQTVNSVSNNFHIYTMIWTENDIEFQVDGVTHYTYQPSVQDDATWPFDAPQYLLFNVAILPNIHSSFTQSNLEIDYVRVYQETLSNDSFTKNQIKIHPNPVSDQLKLDGLNTEVSYIIFNNLGQPVKKGNIKNNQPIEVNSLSKGLYHIKINDDKHSVIIKKLIKQ